MVLAYMYFIAAETKDFVETLFEVLTTKSYIKPEEPKPVPLPDTTDPLPELVPVEAEIQPTVLTPIEDEIRTGEEGTETTLQIKEVSYLP